MAKTATKKKITDQVKTIEDLIKIAKPSVEELALISYNGPNVRMMGAKFALLRFMICDVLNEGWVPNWKDTSEKKWYQWYDMDSDKHPSGVGFSGSNYADWDAGSGVGSRLCLKSRELSDFAEATFPEVFIGFLTK